MKALLLGGTEELAETLRVVLRVRWHDLALIRVSDCSECLAALRREEPSLLLMACEDNVAWCCDIITQVRSFSDVPLVVVGLWDDVVAKVRALETGADDWIRPDSMPMEFIARVHALVRRCNGCDKCGLRNYCNGPLSIDFATQEVRINGRQTALTATEFKVLCELVRNEGSVVTRERLLLAVWGGEECSDPEYVKKYIHRLRVKLEVDPAEPHIIVNRRGVGYMLTTASSSN